MRIGLDLHAIQAPSCRGRGIGRYAESLASALMAEAPAWEFVFYRRDDLPLDWDPGPGARPSRWVSVPPDTPGRPDGSLQDVVQRNAEGLDWLLVPNPLVERRGYAAPEPVPGGPRLAAVVHDLIPALFPRHYLGDPRLAAEYGRDLGRLRAYDLLLANSEATARDVRDRLGVPARRVVNIRAAADPAFFRPALGDDNDDRRVLADHGVGGPFFYYLGNCDWRKNVTGLVDAYALLPEEVRRAYRLVLTFQANAWFLERLRALIDHHGLGDRVVLTGPAGDESIRAFYRRAELFLFPSLYEGFGLPILEAMSCGAAVVVADNSSQPEVAGPAGALAATGDAADWAAIVAALVRDPDRVAAMRRAARDQAARFSWGATARALRDAVAAAPPRRARRDGPIALVPCPSADDRGFDARGAALFDHLGDAWRPLVFSDPDRAAALPTVSTRLRWHHRRLLGRVGPILGVSRVLYLVDTLEDPGPLLDDLAAYPGVVAFCNGGLSGWPDLVPGQAAGAAVEEALRAVLRRATAVACHSTPLHRQLLPMAGSDGAARVHLVDAADDPGAAADAYLSLFPAS